MNMTEIGEHDQKVDNDQTIFGQIHLLHVCHCGNIYSIFNFGQIQLYFGHIQTLMFVVVNFWSSSNVNVRSCHFFGSNSNQFLVILIGSSKLASFDSHPSPDVLLPSVSFPSSMQEDFQNRFHQKATLIFSLKLFILYV